MQLETSQIFQTMPGTKSASIWEPEDGPQAWFCFSLQKLKQHQQAWPIAFICLLVQGVDCSHPLTLWETSKPQPWSRALNLPSWLHRQHRESWGQAAGVPV